MCLQGKKFLLFLDYKDETLQNYFKLNILFVFGLTY